MNTPLQTKPSNPLVDEQPVDTLCHVQTALALAQDYLLKSIESGDISPNDIAPHTGLYALLNTASDALAYEIQRLEHYQLLAVVN